MNTPANTLAAPKPSLKELQSLYNILKPSNESKSTSNSTSPPAALLTDRKVMIPITSKAFFEGTLQPTVTVTGNCNGTGTGTGNGTVTNTHERQEQVMVNLGQGYLAEMTTEEASNYVERRMQALRPIKPKPKPKKDSSLKMKKGFLQTKKSKSKPVHAPATDADTNTGRGRGMVVPSSPSPSLPFMEIREEYDRDGNEINAETLDMSKELLYLRQAMQGKGKDKGTTEKNTLLETILDSVAKSGESTSTDQTADDDNNNDNVSDEHASINQSSSETEPRPYEEISSRLDELILLEEEEERNKKTNSTSSKRIQGKGWAKGFLSNDKKAAKKNVNTSTKKVAIAATAPLPPKTHDVQRIPDDSSTAQQSRKVQFLATNEIKEIPRIGTRSIPKVNTSSTPPQSSARTIVQELASSLEHTMLGNNVMQSRSAGQSVPSKSVSLGGIMERPTSSANNTSQQRIITSTSTSTTGDSAAATSTDTEPKKKLSKFAQRRQQQRS